MRHRHRLLRSERGAGAVEFALAAPILFAMIIGIAQLGILFWANAGMTNALAEGARLALVFPRPTDAEIQTRISDRRFGLDPTRLGTPTIAHGATADGTTYADITMTYTVPIDFVFYRISNFTLTQSRRVFTQPVA
jgi:Flp pilus assembly protein TadG